MASGSRDFRFGTGAGLTEVSGRLDRSNECRSLLILGHGSGSNMRVPFMTGLSGALVKSGVATFRYNYPYSDSPTFVPYSGMEMDSQDVLLATVRSAVATAGVAAPDLPLFAGGHSVSGLVATMADAASPFDGVSGLVILGFPLKGDVGNAVHLADVHHPMLFLQGTADDLGDVSEINEMVDGAGDDATVHFVETAGHGFTAPDRSDEDVHNELATTTATWINSLE